MENLKETIEKFLENRTRYLLSIVFGASAIVLLIITCIKFTLIIPLHFTPEMMTEILWIVRMLAGLLMLVSVTLIVLLRSNSPVPMTGEMGLASSMLFMIPVAFSFSIGFSFALFLPSIFIEKLYSSLSFVLFPVTVLVTICTVFIIYHVSNRFGGKLGSFVSGFLPPLYVFCLVNPLPYVLIVLQFAIVFKAYSDLRKGWMQFLDSFFTEKNVLTYSTLREILGEEFFNKSDNVSKLISYLSELRLRVEVEDAVKGEVKNQASRM